MQSIGIRELFHGNYSTLIKDLPLQVTKHGEPYFYLVESLASCNHKCLSGCGRQGLMVYMVDRKTQEKSKGSLCLQHLRDYTANFTFESVD